MYTTEEERQNLHTQLSKWLGDCETSHSETSWQDNAREDYKFYAGEQDTDAVIAELERTNRPTSVYNEIKPKIDMLVGMGSQLEGGVTVLPRTTEDGPLAELMSGTYEYFRDKMRSDKKESSCFEHAVKSGHSWLHFWIDQEDEECILKSERVPGRYCHVDSDAILPDKSDAKYFFRDKWFTADDIEAAWPQFKFARDSAGNVIGASEITGVAASSSYIPTYFDEAKEKYRIVECWWRKYETKFIFLNPITGQQEELFEDEFKELRRELKRGIPLPNGEVLQKDLRGAPKKVKSIWFAIASGTDILEVGRSPYRHRMIPYVYVEAYHDEENNHSLSVINSMKDPQRALNTTRRQLVHLLQTLPKGILVYESGAIVNIEEYEENSSKPGFSLEMVPGGLNKYKFETQPQISDIYRQLDMLFQQSMKDTSGIQDALLGIQTSTREPGITARMRGDASAAVLYTLFTNYKDFKYNCAKITISNIQQFVDNEMVVRIRGAEGFQLMQINSQMNPQAPDWNDITAGQFDLVVDEDMVTKSTKMAVAQMLSDFATNNPGSIPADLMAEYTNMPYTTRVKIVEYQRMQQENASQSAQIEQGFKEKELDIKQYEAVTKRLALDKQKSSGRNENV